MSIDFTVRLERVFQGPMDLLLHLVREQEVEIQDIEISRVIEGYLEYLKAMRELDIELAGDFVVMAATLMSIKSRSLLPGEEVDLDQAFDPRDELIQRLIEYRRFKEVSDDLGRRFETRARQHARGAVEPDQVAAEPALDLGELTHWDLLAAFSRLMRETLADRPHRVIAEHHPLRYYVREMAHRIRARGSASLRELLIFAGDPSREALIGSFCALLELVKLGLVSVVQDARDADIAIRLRPEHEEDIESVVESSVLDDENDAAMEASASAASSDAERATSASLATDSISSREAAFSPHEVASPSREGAFNDPFDDDEDESFDMQRKPGG